MLQCNPVQKYSLLPDIFLCQIYNVDSHHLVFVSLLHMWCEDEMWLWEWKYDTDHQVTEMWTLQFGTF